MQVYSAVLQKGGSSFLLDVLLHLSLKPLVIGFQEQIQTHVRHPTGCNLPEIQLFWLCV